MIYLFRSMKKFFTWMCIAAFCGVFCYQPNDAFGTDFRAGRIIIIGNKELPFDSLSRNDLRDIFYGRKTKWDNRQKIEIALLESRKIHQVFVRYLVQGTSAPFLEQREDHLLHHRNRPGIMFKSEKSIVSHVALTKGAIGYISSYTKPIGVKVIEITEAY